MVERRSADGLAGAAGCVGATFAAKRTVAPGAAAGLATGAIVPARDAGGFCGGIAVGEGNSIVCGAVPAGLGAAGLAEAGADSRFARKVLPHFPHRTGRPCGPIRASSIRYRAWHLSQRTSIVGPSGTDRNVR